MRFLVPTFIILILAWGSAQAQTASESLRETHGDWSVVCDSANQADCYMVAQGVDLDGSPLVEMSLVRFAPGRSAVAGATVIVPLGTALPEGVVLQVDQGERIRFAFDFCAPAGCVANLALTPDLLQSLRAGSTARISVAPASRPEIPKTTTVSLIGFTAAYESLPAGTP